MKIFYVTLFLFLGTNFSNAQPPANTPARPHNVSQPKTPDLTHISDPRQKLKVLSVYCDSLKASNTGGPNTFSLNDFLLMAALKGLSLVPAGDALDSARFLAYAAHAY